MPLAAGVRLGPYEVLAPLGAGAMGEVYRARDPRLSREVAIKIVHTAGSGDGEMRRRFEHEARAAGSLNHPNVLAVFDVGTESGTPFVVSELLEGQTLGERLAEGALPPKRAIEYALQIAAGLAAAHDKGIVHRDLKPDNVFVTRDGRVKILDFGLAKLVHPHALTEASTATGLAMSDDTPSGTVLGSLGYMSPEQLRGLPADARSDLFAFGALLYEMLSGRRAFKGPTPADTMTAILREDPPELARGGGAVTPPLERIIRRCLEKEPDARFQTVRDLAFALDALSGISTSGGGLATIGDPGSQRRLGRRVAALALAAAVGAALVVMVRRPASRPPVTLLRRLTQDSGFTGEPALSADGKLLAFTSDRSGDGNLDIWIVPVGGGQSPLRLTKDPADDDEPAFSPDQTMIAFHSERDGGGIYVVPVFGGDERLIARKGRHPRFSPDGSRIAFIRGEAGSGTAVVITTTGTVIQEIPNVTNVVTPVWSPDGRYLLLDGSQGERPTASSTGWVLVRVETNGAGSPATIQVGTNPLFERDYSIVSYSAWSWSGERVLFQGLSSQRELRNGIWEAALAPGSFRVVPPVRQVVTSTEDLHEPSRTPDGRVVFSAQSSSTDLAQISLDGGEPAAPRLDWIPRDLVPDWLPAVSDDGRKLVFISSRLGNPDIWLRDLVTGRESAVTVTPEGETLPVLSHDGKRVFYTVATDVWASPEKASTYAIPTAGGIAETVCRGCGVPSDVSQDGLRVLLRAVARVGGQWTEDNVVAMFDTTNGRQTAVLQREGYNLYRAHFSPDEKWIVFHAYHRSSGGVQEFIAPFRGAALVATADWIPVTDGKTFADASRWSPHGDLVYYLSDRDGNRCVWAQRLDERTKHPVGEPFAVAHIHDRQRTLKVETGGNPWGTDLAIAGNRMILDVTETRSNVWMAEFR